MTTTTPEATEGMIRKITALMERAEHPGTPAPEAASCRAKAQELMDKYRVEEETLRQERKAAGIGAVPTEDMFDLCSYKSEYRNHYYSLFSYVARHLGVRFVAEYRNTDAGYMLSARLVGFDTDIRLVEAIYLSLRLHFQETLEPQYDRSLSLETNVYRLRNAGIERGKIGVICGLGDKAAQRVTNIYIKACAERGEDPKVVGKTLNAKTYRSSFADSYVNTIWSRLHEMAGGSGVSESGALVLANRKEEVDEAFYNRFPHLRPVPVKREDKEPCAKCLASKRGACREHYVASGSWSPRPYSSQGAAAGRSAARTADLSGMGKAPQGRLS